MKEGSHRGTTGSPVLDGLDYAERYRNLRYVAVLDPDLVGEH